ncbi:MAG: gamma-glutamylcyclotransferase family protein [Pseudomonadota bacterium]
MSVNTEAAARVSSGTHLLFVYGTLMPDVASRMGVAQRKRLAAQSQRVCQAVVRGVLYDFGPHPALQLTGAPGDQVHGVLLALDRPATTFQWLDPYESIRGAPGFDLYARVLAPVELERGACAVAWIYDYVAPIREARRIETGRWSPRDRV